MLMKSQLITSKLTIKLLQKRLSILKILAKKSACAGGLCDFIINITAYYNVVVSVEPKKLAVAEAKATLEAATIKKAEVDALVNDLKEKLAVL